MNIQAWLSWINNNEAYIEVTVFIVFIMIASNRNNYNRFIAVLLDCISAAGHMVLNFSESFLGVLSSVEDFFEALTYVLFGNFSSAIRFIMANYVVLFASIVSFLTTLWGLEKILDWRLAIVLSFAIQMVLVLMSLYLAQQFWGEPVKWKRGVEYYLKNYYPTRDLPSTPSDEQRKVSLIKKWLPKFKIVPCLIITLLLIIISSMLTYVYLYDTILDDYMVYKTAYALMEEVEKDTAENVEKLNEYYKNARIILNTFGENAGKNNDGGNSLYELLDFLNGNLIEEADGDMGNIQNIEKADKIFQNFEEYVRGINAEFQDGESSLFGNVFLVSGPAAVWNQDNVHTSYCNSKDDIILLARNILDLKLYSNEQLESVESYLKELRKYLVEADTQSESGPQNNIKKADKKVIREKVQQIILSENDIYANVPILQDIQVAVSVNDEIELQKWVKPIERGYATKYEDYLEIADARLLVAGRAFDALFHMDNAFLQCMFALSFISDMLVLISCLVRAKQEAGKNNRVKRNLIHSIFIKSLSGNFGYVAVADFLFFTLCGIGILGWIYIKNASQISDGQRKTFTYIATGLCIFGIIFKTFSTIKERRKEIEPTGDSEDKRMIQDVLTACGLRILKNIKNKVLLKEVYILQIKKQKGMEASACSQPVYIEKLAENARSQEFYVDCGSITHEGCKEEILLLCCEELAYPVMDRELQTKGYVITKECVRLLIKEMFDAAKKNGLDIRMFKEDLKEYEEDIWG